MEYISASSLEVTSEQFQSDTLTVSQAARRAGVTQSAIIRWIRNGYLPATSSDSGWQIPADRLDAAQAAAEESRGTGPVPRPAGPRLVPAPAELRRSLAVQAEEQPARLDVLSETLVSPLVELIRDQTDVVQDQAEVIGWLQAERSRLNSRLSELAKAQNATPVEDTATVEHEDTDDLEDSEDEVVSWLWNDAARPFETMRALTAEQAQRRTASAGSRNPLIYETRAAEYDRAEPATQPVEPATMPADTASATFDDSWFVIPNADQYEAATELHDTSVPRLRPIVARSKSERSHSVIPDGDADLGQLIDETERKIAEMWRNEAQLSSKRGGTLYGQSDVESADDDQESFWQRVWPLKRRAS